MGLLCYDIRPLPGRIITDSITQPKDKPALKADLHCHSHYSDGGHPPDYLLRQALEQGLSHLAITDHDCIAAHADLEVPAGLSCISGVEISCDWQGREIHVVGLGFSLSDNRLNELLQRQQSSRRQRIAAFDSKLQSMDIHGLQDYIDALPCHACTRSHVAQFLVQAGHSKNLQKAFKKFLGRRGRIYTAANWCSLDEAVQTIGEAGGLTILAHPGRYPLSKRKLLALVQDFKHAGGVALEASYANIHPDLQKQLSALAEEQELFVSQGSDFHSAEAHWTALGKFPSLGSQAQKNAIWHHPGWHSLSMRGSESPKPAA